MKRNALNLPDKNIQKDTEEIRLQAFLAHCGVASRRASEQIITDGRVCVNGSVVTELGTKVSKSDVVTVDGKQIFLEENKRYVLLNKPAGYVCSSADEKGRAIAADLLKEKYSERLYSIGRLDMYSKGMILFTNDGDFAARLSHPSSELEKEYIVETSQNISDELPVKLEHGVRVDGVFYKPLHVEKLKERKLKIVLIEGKNREIRKMLENENIGTKSLVRVRIGCVKLNELKPGECRNLTKKEVSDLLELCNKK